MPNKKIIQVLQTKTIHFRGKHLLPQGFYRIFKYSLQSYGIALLDDPVMLLKCQHNFCRALAHQSKNCPEFRERFSSAEIVQPRAIKNMTPFLSGVPTFIPIYTKTWEYGNFFDRKLIFTL